MNPLDYARLQIHESHREAFAEAWKSYRPPSRWRWDRIALAIAALFVTSVLTLWLVYIVAFIADFMGLYS